MAKNAKPKDKVRYGVGEWFGHLVASTPSSDVHDLATKSKMSVKDADMPCPFRRTADTGAICNKKGGVCSLRKYQQGDDGSVTALNGLVTVCPNRFWEDNTVFKSVGEAILDTDKPIIVKEVDFLEGLAAEEEAGDADEEAEAVGRIDMILIHPDDPKEWCAVEVQAVYFSGKKMGDHLAQFENIGNAIPFPNAIRRPDFRSSGPKRLMPQLQTKVPTLRRWGRKTAVIIDAPFSKSLGQFERIDHISNCDIVWIVVDFDVVTGKLYLAETIKTTLKTSVEALTAGVPTSKQDFEAKVGKITSSKAKAMQKKVFNLS